MFYFSMSDYDNMGGIRISYPGQNNGIFFLSGKQEIQFQVFGRKNLFQFILKLSENFYLHAYLAIL